MPRWERINRTFLKLIGRERRRSDTHHDHDPFPLLRRTW
ncbi:hypothetical protein MINT15_35570 [Saccharomonospora viridis]|uniref:Uncharacterized protein n=1 Tax=Saccharomonospora viridis TaxID=1852 RepID=A0A837D815_9PSEU|nr:hypothetical protein MINT15_35570 [Saccharomonospora viridis]